MKNFKKKYLLVTAIVAIIVVLVSGIIIFFNTLNNLKKQMEAEPKPSVSDKIDSFEECAAADYPIRPSDPRQCRTPDGQVFIESKDQEKPKQSLTPTPTAKLDTPAPSQTTPGETMSKTLKLIGIMAVPPSEFSKAKNLGALAVEVHHHLSSSELQSALQTAKSLGLGLLSVSQGNWQKSDYKIDFVKLENTVSNVFSGNNIASDPDFLGYYLIDEPCHENKWDISPSEFRQFYETVKGVDPDIPILVNFGFLGCLESKIPENGGKIVDIATFVVGTKKLRQSPDYIADEAATAQRIKQFYPDIQIVPLIAVWEYPAKGEPLPSANWVRQVGLEVFKYDSFDGIMLFPWSPSRYMGQTIEDVADDSQYISAFKEVFEAAK